MIWNRPDLMNRVASLLWALGLLLIVATAVLMIDSLSACMAEASAGSAASAAVEGWETSWAERLQSKVSDGGSFLSSPHFRMACPSFQTP